MRSYLRYFNYAKPYRAGWGLISLASVLSSVLAWLQPWPMQFLVDHVLARAPESGRPPLASPISALLAAALATLVLFLLSSVLDYVTTCTWVRVGQRMVYDVMLDVFAHLQQQSLSYHGRHSVGDSMARATGDCWCVNSLIESTLLAPARALITASGMLVIMARLDGTLALVTLCTAPVMALSAMMMKGRVRTTARARRELASTIQSHVHQTITGMHIVQAFTQEDRQHDRFNQYATAAIRLQQRTIWLRNLAMLGTGLAAALGNGLVLLIGAKHVLAGQCSLGSLLVFIAYLNTLQSQVRSLAGTYLSWQELRAQFDRVDEILFAPPELKDEPLARPVSRARGHVQIERLTFGYDPGRAVLVDITLDAEPGQQIAIVGATGAGKTTLTKLIPRFLDPWSGRVLVDGHDVRTLKLRDLRRQVAVVWQDTFLFPVSVAENIACGRLGASRAEIEAAARAARAHDFIAGLPKGYDTVLAESGATLSGGERQRIAIARAFLKDAPILVMDEPTSGLDAGTEALLMEALQELTRSRTTFIVAHRLSTVRKADTIVVLENGRFIETGTHQDLIRLAGAYARLSRQLAAEDFAP